VGRGSRDGFTRDGSLYMNVGTLAGINRGIY
jgi:hypothetical protein